MERRDVLKRIQKMNEVAWALGIILCALGVALCTKANFGLSMVSAPPYIMHLKLSGFSSFFTQGTTEYIWEGLLLILLCAAIKRFRPIFLLSFVSALLFGFTLDGWLFILGSGAAYTLLWQRILAFVFGELITALSIAFFFRTDMPLLIYELIIKEVSLKWNLKQVKVKYASDISMLVISFLMAIFLNKSFKGIGVGTIIITLINAPLITYFGAILDRLFVFNSLFRKEVKNE